MTLFTITSFIAFFIYINVGLFVLYSDIRSRLNRHFFYFCLMLALYALFHTILFSPIEETLKDALQKYSYIPMLMFAIIMIKFILIFTNFFESRKVRLLYYSLVWIVPAFISYKSITANAIVNDYPSGFWLAFMITSAIYNLFSVSLMIVWWKRTKIKREKKQAKIFVIFSMYAIIAGFIVDLYAGYHNQPPLAMTATIIWIFAMLYIVVKYRFMQLTPKLVSGDILNSIDEGVMLFDENLKVIFVNQRAEQLAGYKPDTVNTLNDNLIDNLHYGELISNFLTNFEHDISTKMIYKTRINERPFDLQFKKIYDKGSDLLGILCIAKEIVGFEYLARRFNLTKREEQIILNVISGIRHIEIAEKLNIAERTVKAHITNIYTKIGVKNKIELYNMLNDFNIKTNSINKNVQSVQLR